jgi:hypothetical protein
VNDIYGFMLVHFQGGDNIVFHEISNADADVWTDLITGGDLEFPDVSDGDTSILAINTEKVLSIEWVAY